MVEERVKISPMDFLYHEQVCVHGWKEESSKSFLDRRLKLADPSRSGGNAKRFSPGNRRIAEEEEEDGVRSCPSTIDTVPSFPVNRLPAVTRTSRRTFCRGECRLLFRSRRYEINYGGNFSPRHGRRIDSSVSVLIKRIPSEIPQREFNARCYSRSHDSRCDSCYRRRAICRTENCLHSFFLWDHPSSIVIIGT